MLLQGCRTRALQSVAAFLVVSVLYLLSELLPKFGFADRSSGLCILLVVAACVLTLMALMLGRGILQLRSVLWAFVAVAVAVAATVAQLLSAYVLGSRLSAWGRRPVLALFGNYR